MNEIWNDARELVSKLFESPQAKLIGSVFLGLVHELFGKVLLPAHSAVIVLIIIDWIFGLTHAVLAREISSAKSLRGVIKLTLYGGIFIVGAQLDKVEVVGPFLNGSLIGVMVLTESVSVLENIDKLARLEGVELTWIGPIINLLNQRRNNIVEGKERCGDE